MFRAKIILTYFVLLGVLTGGAYFILHGSVQSSLEQGAQESLRRSATVAQQALRLDELALIEKAQFTAQGQQLYSTMRLNDNQLLYDELFARYPEAKTADGVRHVAVYDEPLKVDELRMQEAAKSAGNIANQDRRLYARTPAVPDIFMVLDQNGKGVAALGKGRKRWWRNNVAEKYPIVLSAVQQNQIKTDVWQWAWNETDSTDLYRVAIVPIRPTPGQAARGVVVAGMLIHDGLASDSQELLAGFTSSPSPNAALAPKFAFFQGDRVVASTFKAADEAELSAAAFSGAKLLDTDAPDTIHTLEFGGQSYHAVSRFFSGEFGVADAPAGFMVLSAVADAKKPVALASTNLIALAGATLLVGIILILFFIQASRKPLSELENGLGEVIAGNKDHVFETTSKDEVFINISQGLNLMSAFLQGKPMPDDPNAHGDWGELMAENDANANAAPGKVTGVALPGLGARRKPSATPAPAETPEEPSDEPG